MDTIDLLRRQIEEMRIPPLPTQQEQEQIMKNRKSQADIDAGRRAIQERVDAHNAANAKRGELITQLRGMEETARTQGEQDARKAYDESLGGRLMNTLKAYGPFAAGGGAGYLYGAGTNALLDRYERSNARNLTGISKTLDGLDYATPQGRAAAQGAVEASRSFMPSPGAKGLAARAAGLAGRATAYGAPAGAMLYEAMNYRNQASDESLPQVDRDNARMIGNVMLGAGGGTIIEGGRRAIFPRRPETLGPAIAKIRGAEAYLRDNPAGGPATALSPARPTIDITPERLPPVPDAPPAQLPPPDAEAPEAVTKQRHRDRLVSAAKEAGASGPLTKTAAAEHLLANVTDANRGAIARSLGVANGPNLHKRLMAAIKDMAAKPGASAIVAGLAGAAAASTDPAEAADGSSGGLADRAIAGGTAAGTAYGVSRLAQALGPIASGALATGGTMMAPMAAADAYDPTPTQLLKDRVRGAELLRMVLPESLAARLGGAMEDAYQMARVPARGDRSPAAYRARDDADIAADREALAQEMPLPQASALTIPEGIPAPNPDGSSPFPEDASSAPPAPPYSPMVMGRLSRMQKFGASPEQIAHFLNQAVR